MNKQKIMDVFAIPDAKSPSNYAWPKIGVAILNHDDSINVILDFFPRVGIIHIRPSQPSNTEPRGKA